MATIIKRGEQTLTPAGDSVRGVAFDLEEMADHGDRYLTHVRNEAAKIVQQANTDAQQIRQQAEAAGRQAAEQAIDRILAQKVGQQMQTLKPAIEQLVGELAQARDEWLAHWERAAVDLSGRIAERIVRREIENKPEITVEWAREALEMAAGASEAVVKLSPADHANLGEHTQAIADAVSKGANTTVVADRAVTPGGCVVQTRHGVIDAQIETQLARMIAELTPSDPE